MTGIEYDFLEDRPLEEEKLDNLRFGHDEIAETLADTIKSCPTPFTIGLFGGWGSGKSTIANKISSDYLDDIETVKFDVWKYEGDSLRRSFLKEFAEATNTEEEISVRNTKDVIRKEQEGFTIDYKATIQLFFIFLFGIILSAFFYQVIPSLTLLPISVILFLAGLSKDYLIKTVFPRKGSSYIDSKFSEPHEFEKEFQKLLRNQDSKRILITFDNLDRVSDREVMITLNTIRTFLEPEKETLDSKNATNPVFLVPCDDKAIKKHIDSYYSPTQNYDSNKFLRKFFDSVIEIDDFQTSDLENYTKQQLEKTGAEGLNNDTVSWLIKKSFRDSPRRIKQFINLSLQYYILIEKRQRNGDFQSGFLPEKSSQLIKYLIIKEKFPKCLEKIQDENYYDFNQNNITRKLENKEKESENEVKVEKFSNYLEETKRVEIEDLKILCKLRLSEIMSQFDGLGEIFQQFKDNSETEVNKNLVREIRENKEEFGRVFEEEIENTSGQTSKAHLTDKTIQFLVEKDIESENLREKMLFNCLNDSKIKETSLMLINPIYSIQYLNSHKNARSLIKRYLDVLTSSNKPSNKSYSSKENFEEILLTSLSKNLELLEDKDERRIKVILENNYASSTKLLDNISKLPKESQETFISPKFIKNLLVGNSKIDEVIVRCEAVLNLDKKLKTSSLEEIKGEVSKLILNSEQIVDSKKRKKKLFGISSDLLEKEIERNNLDIKTHEVIDGLTSLMINLEHVNSWDKALPGLIKYLEHLDEEDSTDTAEEILDITYEFISVADKESIRRVENDLEIVSLEDKFSELDGKFIGYSREKPY